MNVTKIHPSTLKLNDVVSVSLWIPSTGAYIPYGEFTVIKANSKVVFLAGHLYDGTPYYRTFDVVTGKEKQNKHGMAHEHTIIESVASMGSNSDILEYQDLIIEAWTNITHVANKGSYALPKHTALPIIQKLKNEIAKAEAVYASQPANMSWVGRQ